MALSSADIVQDQPFQKCVSVIPSACQPVWAQIRPDALSGLIRVKIVCKFYQQTTLVGKELPNQFEKNHNEDPYTFLPAKSDSDVMFCLQSCQGLIIDRSLVH